MRRVRVFARSFRRVAFRSSLLILAVGLAGISGKAQPSSPPATATFHAIGDLPGGPVFSAVRDAVKHNGVIYAVGGSAERAQSCATPQCLADTATLWTFDGTTAALTPIPNLVTNTTAASFIVAAAITPDAAYIAAQLRNVSVGITSVAARTTTAGLSSINLNVAPYTTFAAPNGAIAISADGSVLYGSASGRAVRYDVGIGSALIPLLNAGDTQNNPALRGTSSDGSVMVGTSNGPSSTRAYRYVHGTGVSAIPLRPGGTTNRALAVSPDGNLTLVSGPNPFLPKGEVYLHDAATNAITPLGSPNTAWAPATFGGMNADGSVVGMMFASSTPGVFARDAYIRNSNGWFPLHRVLAIAGAPLGPDWNSLSISGISPDGTLVFGQGQHNGNLEGFVAEFPTDYLANFDVPAVPPADTRIVGAWLLDDPEPNPALANPVILMFLADGTYFHIEANVPASELSGVNGFERGRYTWDSTTGAFTVTALQDTNGGIGVAGPVPGLNAQVTGDTLTIQIAGCVPMPGGEPCVNVATRIGGPAGSLVGGWFAGDPTKADSSLVVVFLANGSYYFVQDGLSEGPGGDPNGQDGLEKGTWLWNSSTGALSLTTTVDTNGQWGLNFVFPLPGNTSLTAQPSPDGWRTLLTAGTETALVSRVGVATGLTPTGTTVVVQPTSGSSGIPVTVQFDTVTSSGVTTLEVIDPSALPADRDLPSGFTLGVPPMYFEITTTATFTGPVTVCFSYAGVTFSSGAPRLLHYDLDWDWWVDITRSVDAATMTICGLTSSFSPFAIASSQATHSGFAAPISPVGGFQNVVKGGATVPLKFNLFINGVEKTDTAGLVFSVVEVGCDAGAGEAPVPFLTTGATSLRYAGDQFVQNWKTPQTPGCYLVRVTGDGILVSALFKVK